MESAKILNSQMRFASSVLLWVLETLESECELRHKSDCESFRNSSLISHGALRNLVTMKINFAPRKTAENTRAEVWSLAEKIISEERQKSLNSASRSNRERKFVQEWKSISCCVFCSPTQHHHRRARFTGRKKRKSLRLFHPHHRVRVLGSPEVGETRRENENNNERIFPTLDGTQITKKIHFSNVKQNDRGNSKKKFFHRFFRFHPQPSLTLHCCVVNNQWLSNSPFEFVQWQNERQSSARVQTSTEWSRKCTMKCEIVSCLRSNWRENWREFFHSNVVDDDMRLENRAKSALFGEKICV